MRWEGRAARVGEMRNPYRIVVENLKGREHLRDLVTDERLI
jgi:hypothetical protein